VIARAAAGGALPPFGSVQEKVKGLVGVTVDFGSAYLNNGEVIFKALVKDQDGFDKEVWVRPVYRHAVVQSEDSKDIEKRVLALIGEAGGDEPPIPPDPSVSEASEEPEKPRQDATEIDAGVYAVFGREESGVKNEQIFAQ
jgi:hypothetical protein